MQTADSRRFLNLFGSVAEVPDSSERGGLGMALLKKMNQVIDVGWKKIDEKPVTLSDEAMMAINLQNTKEIEISGIGKGIHRPFKVRFRSGFQKGVIDCRIGVAKTVQSHYETSRYRKSMDTSISGPEREILAYDVDKVCGFDLVPPTVGRNIDKLGFCSVQAWVRSPSAWEWLDKGYDYRKDTANPWLHRLVAFDYITGAIDRHSANWMIDKKRRMYAIDNGYSFVKDNDKRFFRSSAGKALKGISIHPAVQWEINAISESTLAKVLQRRPFFHGEVAGVIERLRFLKGLSKWGKLGGLW